MYIKSLGHSFPMVTIFITPTVFSVNGLWLLTSGLSGHSGEHHKEGTHFADTQDPVIQPDLLSS